MLMGVLCPPPNPDIGSAPLIMEVRKHGVVYRGVLISYQDTDSPLLLSTTERLVLLCQWF